MRKIAVSIGCCLILAAAHATCRADGGAVRAIEQVGRLQISAFTSPNPLVAPTVDISVLVQDRATHAPVKDLQVEVTIVPRDRSQAAVTLPATTATATNKLFRDCLVELSPGWHDVTIACAGSGHQAQIHFAMEVGVPRPQIAALWPWFAWPLVPVVLFSLHRLLTKPRQPARQRRSTSLQ